MKFTPNFNPEENKILIELESNLFESYYNNFVGLVKNDPKMPSGIDVIRNGKSSVTVTFPATDASIEKKTGDTIRVGIPREKMENIQNVVNKFVNSALKVKLKKTEFIPLSGYPVEKLQEDIKVAAKNKRDLCIIDTYQEFLDMEAGKGTYTFHQVLIESGNSEWADVILLLYKGDLEKVKELYGNKTTRTEWY